MGSGTGMRLWRAALAAWAVFFVLLYAFMTYNSVRTARAGIKEPTQVTLYRTGALFAGLAGLLGLRISLKRGRPE